MNEVPQSVGAVAAIRKKNRRTLLLILAVSAAPVALAWLAFLTGLGVPGETVNHGLIIEPALKVESLLQERNDEFLQGMEQNRKWHLFIPYYGACSEDCQQILYLTRQVHLRLGDKSSRVERVLVNLAGRQGEDFFSSIAAEHPKLKRVDVVLRRWEDWAEKSELLRQAGNKPVYLLVDQEGFAMMLYGAEVSGGDLLKDLKRVLKHSIDYS